jgi:cation:H+ antiporter
MILQTLLILVGFALLVRGADILVRGASSLARRFGVSSLLVGLTVVAMGTSMPELVVNVLAALRGSGDIAIGNILGSNIVNIALGLGLAALVLPLTVERSIVWREIPFALLAVGLLAIVANDRLLDGAAADVVSRIDGLVLLSLVAVYLYYLITTARASRQPEETPDRTPPWRSAWDILIGVLLLVIGGKFVVDNAVLIAAALGISEKLIALTVIAVGTSLPELVTSVIAVMRKEPDISVGNIVGSNILNIIVILGLSATLTPLAISPSAFIDLGVTMLLTLLLFAYMYVGKRHELERWQGATFVVLYLGYIVFLIGQG